MRDQLQCGSAKQNHFFVARKLLCALLFGCSFLPLPVCGEISPVYQADQFVDSVGLVIHLGASNYLPWDTVRPFITGLGIRHVRDGFDTYQAQPNFAELAHDYRIKSTFVVDTCDASELLDPKQIAKELSVLKNNASLLAATEAIEGPNEYDLTSDKLWASRLLNYQQALYDAVKADPALRELPVLGPSLGKTDHLTREQLGDMSHMVDVGNAHPYPKRKNSPDSAVLHTYLQGSREVWPGKRLESTEEGFSTVNNEHGVSETVQAQYVVRMALENFRQGIARTFVDELMDVDAPADTANHNHHYGLVHRDDTPKASYACLANLLSILSDPGAPFTPRNLPYEIRGQTANVHELLLAKRDGDFYLVLWAETQESASQKLTITFDESVSAVAQFTPIASATATPLPLYARETKPAHASVDVTAGSDPIILRISEPAQNSVTIQSR